METRFGNRSVGEPVESPHRIVGAFWLTGVWGWGLRWCSVKTGSVSRGCVFQRLKQRRGCCCMETAVLGVSDAKSVSLWRDAPETPVERLTVTGRRTTSMRARRGARSSRECPTSYSAAAAMCGAARAVASSGFASGCQRSGRSSRSLDLGQPPWSFWMTSVMYAMGFTPFMWQEPSTV